MIEYPNLECAWQSLKTLIWRKEICDKYGRRGKKDGQNMLVKILKEPKNAIIKQYQKLLEKDLINFKKNSDSCDKYAE